MKVIGHIPDTLIKAGHTADVGREISSSDSKK